MKKILTSLILCATLLCGVFVFSSCNNGYNLGSLKNDYMQLADNCKEVSISHNCELQFNYAVLNVASTNFSKIMDNNPRYANIRSVYNKLLSNSLYLTYQFIEACSNNDINVEKGFKNQIKLDLQAVGACLDNTHNQLMTLVDKLAVAYPLNELSSAACLTRLENVFDSYNDLIEASLKLSKDLSTLYFNYILEEDNPDYYGTNFAEFDSSLAIASIKNNICCQVVNLTQNYFNNYVKGSDIGDTIANGNVDFSISNSAFKTYSDNVHKIVSVDFRTSAGDAIDASSSLKLNFYTKLVKLHNLQAVMKNDAEKYSVASQSISYIKSKNDLNATSDEKMYVELIENYTYIVNEYNTTLVELLDIISSVS